MAFGIKTREADGAVIVDLSVRLVLGTPADELRAARRHLLDAGQRAVVVNLAALESIDSMGLGVLVAALASVLSRDGRFVLLSPPGRIDERLQLATASPVFDVCGEETDAVGRP